MTMVYDLLNQYEKQHGRRPPAPHLTPTPRSGAQLMQAPPNTVFVAGTDGHTNRNIQCWNTQCVAWGHMRTECPLLNGNNRAPGGALMMQYRIELTQRMNDDCNNMINMTMHCKQHSHCS
jgi:hypothetical protein